MCVCRLKVYHLASCGCCVYRSCENVTLCVSVSSRNIEATKSAHDIIINYLNTNMYITQTRPKRTLLIRYAAHSHHHQQQQHIVTHRIVNIILMNVRIAMVDFNFFYIFQNIFCSFSIYIYDYYFLYTSFPHLSLKNS